MGKKQELIIEEVSDEEFDGEFSDEEDAPVALNRKDAQAKYEKVP